MLNNSGARANGLSSDTDMYIGRFAGGGEWDGLLGNIMLHNRDLTAEEVLNPKGFILVSFIMDPRTGLGRFRDFRISNYQLMEDTIQNCSTKTGEEILEIPDIK